MKSIVVALLLFNVHVTLVSGQAPCWSNLTTLFETVKNQTFGEAHTYNICPGTYEIGFRVDRTCCVNGHHPLVARTNTHYLCGDDGASSNGCIFTGGTFHVEATNFVFEDPEVTNCTVQGVTFRSPQDNTAVANLPGDFTFEDCIFEDQRNSGPILAIHFPPFNRLLSELDLDPAEPLTSNQRLGLITELARSAQDSKHQDSSNAGGMVEGDRSLQGGMTLNFFRCIFQNNEQGDIPEGGVPLYGIISSVSAFNRIIVRDSVFRNNEFDTFKGYAIATTGSHLEIFNTCFLDNNFKGLAPVEAVGGATYQVLNNYGTADDELTCSFMALSALPAPNASDVTCLSYDALSCQASIFADLPPLPTKTPTLSPTDSPTRSPVVGLGPTTSMSSTTSSTTTATTSTSSGWVHRGVVWFVGWASVLLLSTVALS